MVVKARLAAGRSIHHRKERRRDIDTSHAAFISGCSKTYNIRQHPSADSHYHAATREADREEKIPNLLHRLKGLFRFGHR